MIASNSITVAHAEALLKATPPEQRTDVKPSEREKKTAPIEQIEKLEKAMTQGKISTKKPNPITDPTCSTGWWPMRPSRATSAATSRRS